MLLFQNWSFAKYGADAGCPRCLELYVKGSSSHGHSALCPTITGIDPSPDVGKTSATVDQFIAEELPPNDGATLVSSNVPVLLNLCIIDELSSIVVLMENMYSTSTERTLGSDLCVKNIPATIVTHVSEGDGTIPCNKADDSVLCALFCTPDGMSEFNHWLSLWQAIKVSIF